MPIAAALASPWSTWAIAGFATAGVITRPFFWPEFVWAVGGAGLLELLGLLSPWEAWSGIARGADVYLFLTGMMLLSELARQEGLFDWLAAHAAAMTAKVEAPLPICSSAPSRPTRRASCCRSPTPRTW